ncbi:MAG: winged helix-turn-helix domain-containing protein, partial [Motiliproteus sp.]|nr:winged helix-turn-helix domain-containing protein [Motiliproteus sp.]
VIRRHHGYAENTLSHAGLTLNTDSQQLSTKGSDPVQLKGIEYRLMRLLLLNPDRILSKSEITDHIYEEELQRDSNVVEVYVNKLRQRFGKALIETHRGQGYKLGCIEP